ncbi:MAG: hypothetical protein JNK73_08950 [Bacteroidia bacterium]|nr:hypothetical protein [Bacteroidia bacterium]
MRLVLNIPVVIAFFLLFFSCQSEQKNTAPVSHRVFEGYHVLLDDIIRTRHGVFRGLDLNTSMDSVKKAEPSEPKEAGPNQLYYEYRADSLTDYSIEYTFSGDSLQEINVQISSNDEELISYLFCDLKDYYSNKLPNPIEDQGYVVYNCYEGQRKPFVVTLSDNSSPAKGIINMLIYKDQ